MPSLNRRDLLGLLAATPLAGSFRFGELDGRSTPTATPQREQIQQRYFPNVPLITQDKKKVRFYDDLIKDKVVVIGMMYTKCQGICTGVTQNLVKVQNLLGERMGRNIFFIFITLKPQEDTPEALKMYAEMNHVGRGWYFLTGKPEDTELLRRSLEFVDPNPEVDKDTSRHSGMLRYGNEALTLWASCQSQANAKWIAESISWVDRSKS